MTPLVDDWQDVAAAKRLVQIGKIPKEWRINEKTIHPSPTHITDARVLIEQIKLLDSDELLITSITSVAVLWKLINTKRFSAVQVVTAFCKRAAIAHQLTNCLTEIFFREAIASAKVLDCSGSKGPWHGIPVSLKDQFQVKNQDTSIGYVAGANKPALINSLIVDSILDQGGVFYCKTNVPQTVMTADTVNNLFGRTLNPVNLHIIPSGSTGGEAALIACRGSIIGIGTDTGGSIRNPAAACEIYGLKPSHGRVSYKDVVNSNDGNPLATSVAGPMASSIESCEYFMANTLNKRPWNKDHEMLPLPWTPVDVEIHSLKIGIMLDHGDFPAHPSFYRILERLSEDLTTAGATVVQWQSDELSHLHREIAQVLATTCLMDGGADIAMNVLQSGEPLILPGFVDDKFLLTIPEVWDTNIKARRLRNRYLELWQDAQLDAIICPTNTFAFMTPDEYANKGPEVGYTGLFNMLDYSVVNFPAGSVLAEELSENHNRIGLAGFRVGCQVVCQRLEEEKVIAIAKLCRNLCRE